MREYAEVVIVGAGASGLLCGGMLAEAGIDVTIIEKNNRVGKKLSATGNGRCNFTNRNMDAAHYYGDREWIERALCGQSPQAVIERFRAIGVYPRERDGCLYPHTNQAATVVDALENYCSAGGCEMITGCHVTAIKKDRERGFRIRTSSGGIRCRYVVLATGGKAGAELGGDGGGYQLARSLGHSVGNIYPGLTGLVCGGDWWKAVAGTRIQGRFSLLVNGEKVHGETGEIQVTKDGVSGIPVFQLCRVAAAALSERTGGGEVMGEIDFVPEMDGEKLRQWVRKFGVFGLAPKKWVDILEKSGTPDRLLKEFRFPVRSTYGIERAQVTAGGVPVSEVKAETMESKKVSGLYLMGELLDVDGRCGGYNLHFAWSTACRAAEAVMAERN